MRIALDAMGGDYAPGPNIDGAIAALQAHPELEVVLVGDQPQLEPLLAKAGFSSDRLILRHSDSWITMEEKPTEALRKKPNCSISICWQMMAGREVDAVVSAGHTGAVVAAGLKTRLYLKNVKRPGIAVALPTQKGRAVLVDVGANPAARPEHLFQYGIMGLVYARDVLGIENPRVGLMNIGSEDGKGNDLYRETHSMLQNSRLREAYVGNVEGRDLYQGNVDVIICEGFVGNVVLKVSEGMADFLFKTVAREVIGQLTTERDHGMQALHNVGKRYHYSEEGGAPLLGIDGICIICHGSSNGLSIRNALKVATTFKDRDINSSISAALVEMPLA
ncbi:MAG: glycerol-3-phosphate acyltransferase PlsX [Planctomycetota bacterium]|nr:MAG: glycerol-3-phosphate acyltransferase PlsX [Planctomycetota bacterium]